jgi:hypothetical protein
VESIVDWRKRKKEVGEEIASGASGIFGLYVCQGGVNDFVFRHVVFYVF